MVVQYVNVVVFLNQSPKYFWAESVYSKIRHLTQPRFAFSQKLAALGIIRVWTYEKVGRVFRLESESNTWLLYLKTRLILDIQLDIRLGIWLWVE